MRYLLCCAVLYATPALAADPVPQAPKKPTVKELQALVGKGPAAAPAALAQLARADAWRVNHTIGETDTGLVVAIGVATTSFSAEEIENEKENFHHWEGDYASEQHTPLVFVFQRQPDGSLTPVGGLALPTAGPPHVYFGWGFSKLDDVDGDGRPELAVVYGYTTLYPGSTFGSSRRKEITWLSIDGARLGVQANLVTEEYLSDMDTAESKTAYRLVPRAGTAFKDLRVTVEAHGGDKDTRVWSYDAAKDVWTRP